MYDEAVRVSGFLTEYLSRVVNELPEEALRQSPAPGANPPIWILGHLAVSFDGGLRLLGKPTLCPPEWAPIFTRGTQPGACPWPNVTKEELLNAVVRGSQALGAAVQEGDPGLLASPHSFAPFKATPLQTVGDLLTLQLTGHFAGHVGQLSAYRRMDGGTPLF